MELIMEGRNGVHYVAIRIGGKLHRKLTERLIAGLNFPAKIREDKA